MIKVIKDLIISNKKLSKKKIKRLKKMKNIQNKK